MAEGTRTGLTPAAATWSIEEREGIAVGTRVGLTPPETGSTTPATNRVKNIRVGNTPR